MKKLFPLLALFTGLLQAGLLCAGTININMTDPSGEFRLRSAESAGVVPQPNWNNIPYSPNQNGSTTTNSVIVDGDGEATPLRLPTGPGTAAPAAQWSAATPTPG